MKNKKTPKRSPEIPTAELDWRIAPLPASIICTGWGATVLYFFLQHHPFSLDNLLGTFEALSPLSFWHAYLLKALSALAISAGLLWIMIEGGRQILWRMRLGDSMTAVEQVIFGGALGFGSISFFTFFVGAIHLWYPATFWSALGMASIFLLVERRRQTRVAAVIPAEKVPARVFWLTLLIITGALILAGDLFPEIFFDSLFYHLGFPNLYRLNHRLVSYPQIYSNFIQLVQFVYGCAITIGNSLVPKLLHGATGLLLALSLIAFGQRYLRTGAGLISSALLLSTPLLGYNVTTAGMDVAWTYLQFVSVFALIRFLDQARPVPQPDAVAPVALADQHRCWLILSGILAGLSASCKYPALPYIPLAALILLWQRRRVDHQPWSIILREEGLLIIPALAVVAPFLLRNLVFHGNPLYPFGGVHWGHPRIEPDNWLHFLGDAPQRQLRDEFKSWGAASHFILHPWFTTMEGVSLSDYVGPLFLILLVPLCLVRLKDLPSLILRRFAAGIWLLWLATTSTPRYGLPALALITPVLVNALLSLKRFRVVLLWMVGCGAVLNVVMFYFILFNMEGWRVLVGQLSEPAYLSETRGSYPPPPYEGLAWMNDHLPKEAVVMMIGDNRSYYTDRVMLPASVYDPQPIVDYSQASSGRAMAEALRRDHVTYLFLNLVEAVRTNGYGVFHWDRSSWNSLNEFWSHYVLLEWQTERPTGNNPKALYVYRILSETEAASPHAVPTNPFERWKPA